MKNHLYLSYFVPFVLFFLCSIISCKKDKNPGEPAIDVYVAGRFLSDDQLGVYSVGFWKNRYIGGFYPEKDLTQVTYPIDIKFANQTVYMAGFSNNKPCYWINDVRYNLTDASLDGSAKEILSDKDTLYFSGSVKLVNSFVNHAILWRVIAKIPNQPGAYTPLILDNSLPGDANSIALNNNKIYVGGQRSGKPGYWIVDKLLNYTWHDFIDNLEDGEVNKIQFYNGQLYAFGYKTINNININGYWKDDIFKKFDFLTSGDNISRMGINESGQIFMVGYTNPGIVYGYWIDGEKTAWPGGGLYDIAFLGNNIYLVGNTTKNGIDVACYWKNGVLVDLELPNSIGRTIDVVFK